MERLDLRKILMDCPEGTPLYSQIHGEVAFARANVGAYNYTVEVVATNKDGIESEVGFTADGRYVYDCEGECMLWPSKENRDWTNFVPPKQKPKYKFKPFDKVLVRNSDNDWRIGFFDFEGGDVEHHHYYVIGRDYGFDQCLLYEGNEHLKGTSITPKK